MFERVSFLSSTASSETDALKLRCENQLPALVNWRISHLDSAQSWSVIHHGYGLLFSKMLKEAADHVDQVTGSNFNFTLLFSQSKGKKANLVPRASPLAADLGLKKSSKDLFWL